MTKGERDRGERRKIREWRRSAREGVTGGKEGGEKRELGTRKKAGSQTLQVEGGGMEKGGSGRAVFLG